MLALTERARTTQLSRNQTQPPLELRNLNSPLQAKLTPTTESTHLSNPLTRKNPSLQPTIPLSATFTLRIPTIAKNLVCQRTWTMALRLSLRQRPSILDPTVLTLLQPYAEFLSVLQSFALRTCPPLDPRPLLTTSTKLVPLLTLPLDSLPTLKTTLRPTRTNLRVSHTDELVRDPTPLPLHPPTPSFQEEDGQLGLYWDGLTSC